MSDQKPPIRISTAQTEEEKVSQRLIILQMLNAVALNSDTEKHRRGP